MVCVKKGGGGRGPRLRCSHTQCARKTVQVTKALANSPPSPSRQILKRRRSACTPRVAPHTRERSQSGNKRGGGGVRNQHGQTPITSPATSEHALAQTLQQLDTTRREVWPQSLPERPNRRFACAHHLRGGKLPIRGMTSVPCYTALAAQMEVESTQSRRAMLRAAAAKKAEEYRRLRPSPPVSAAARTHLLGVSCCEGAAVALPPNSRSRSLAPPPPPPRAHHSRWNVCICVWLNRLAGPANDPGQPRARGAS
jgi:hypothetical protein